MQRNVSITAAQSRPCTAGTDRQLVNNTPSLVPSAMIMRFARCLLPFAAAALAACGSAPVKEPSTEPAPAVRPVPAPAPSSKYYKDDGPGDAAPANVDALPDAIPRLRHAVARIQSFIYAPCDIAVAGRKPGAVGS
jgi:hypothetical protein